MKNNKRKAYTNKNNYNLKNIDFFSHEDFFDYMYKIYLKKILKIICIFCTIHFLLDVNISNMILYIKTHFLLRQIIKFEKDKNDDSESEIINFYDINSKDLLLEPNLTFDDIDINNPDISVILQ